jgi:hypothetical protein
MRTRDRLAAELRKLKRNGGDNTAKYEAFARRAEAGEFDDFAIPSDPAHVCPLMQLHSELLAAGLKKFAARVANGEFDATKEESNEWARSPEGQQAAKELPKEIRQFLGMPLLD